MSFGLILSTWACIVLIFVEATLVYLQVFDLPLRKRNETRECKFQFQLDVARALLTSFLTVIRD
jgi:uncharacterized membrane protein